MLGLENDYKKLWEFARLQGGAGNWHNAIETLKDAEKAVGYKVYIDTGAGGFFFTKSLSKEQYRVLINNGGIRSLYDLQQKGALSGLMIDVKGQGTIMNLFPSSIAGVADRFKESRDTIDAILSSGLESEWSVDDEYIKMDAPALIYDLSKPIILSQEQTRQVSSLVREGLLLKEEGNRYTYSSAAVRNLLKKEGTALEAYVYYTLFLSGKFDDVRSNVKLSMGVSSNGRILEKEVDVMVTLDGAMGLISCKDTYSIDMFHIVELANQARNYGTIVRPILVCSKDHFLSKEIKDACKMLQVGLIGIKALNGSETSVNAKMDLSHI